jgi:hypothetical protein
LDAAEMHIDALDQENAMLRCRIQELEGDSCPLRAPQSDAGGSNDHPDTKQAQERSE